MAEKILMFDSLRLWLLLCSLQ